MDYNPFTQAEELAAPGFYLLFSKEEFISHEAQHPTWVLCLFVFTRLGFSQWLLFLVMQVSSGGVWDLIQI